MQISMGSPVNSSGQWTNLSPFLHFFFKESEASFAKSSPHPKPSMPHLYTSWTAFDIVHSVPLLTVIEGNIDLTKEQFMPGLNPLSAAVSPVNYYTPWYLPGLTYAVYTHPGNCCVLTINLCKRFKWALICLVFLLGYKYLLQCLYCSPCHWKNRIQLGHNTKTDLPSLPSDHADTCINCLP